ncbi:uncharacterized protein LOC128244973 [Mya arenaria]|uniref:uncharacterized protein LOC128244973 n=1 Tax=Mya arenaria TaxID=6604 RepID=UPI0022E48622|nr:uncharacterized protein LOC128244973 [Mya arenaria]XP_052819105.1 uncharacterized protein LOC128244973 [Mya arenaria]
MEVSGKRRDPDLDRGSGEETQMQVSGKRRDPDLDKGSGEETQMEVSGKRRDPDLDKGSGEETQMEVSGKRRDPDLDRGSGEEIQMEVSGKRRDPDLDKGSADATVYCQPCGEGGKHAVAQGFCQTCEEYMCDPCIEAHKRFKVSRNHIMLSKDEMPSFYDGSKTRLGTLDMAVPGHVPDLCTSTWMKEADIDIRTSHKDRNWWITGSAMLTPGLLLLADYYNHSVKLVNLNARIVTSCLQLPGQPYGVCVITEDQAAVTLKYKSMIQLVSTKAGQLSCGGIIEVSDTCHGIAFYNNRIYISYTSYPRIEVRSIDGCMISTLQIDDGKQLFRLPYCITVSSFKQPSLYVPDALDNTVLQMSLDGKVLRRYQDKQLNSPESVVEVGPGQLLVCGKGSNNVMLLTERDGKMIEILGGKDGLYQPYSVAFCPQTRCIVVGMENNLLKVYKSN